jgi:hypothetical protein
MKMKIRQIAVRIVLPLLLSGCVPVPSYSVDPYIGSLKQCLDIQGTYGIYSFYSPPDAQLQINVSLVDEAFPRALSKKFWENVRKKEFKTLDVIDDGKKKVTVRTWMTFKFLDDQRVAISIFNELGQEMSFVYNMKEPSREGVINMEDEQFTCNASSWQKSYARVAGGDGRGFKERRFAKLTKLADGSLKKESERDDWSGRLGLYMLNESKKTSPTTAKSI